MSANRLEAIPLIRIKSSKELKGRSCIICAARSGPMWMMWSNSSTGAEFTSTCPGLHPFPLGGGGLGVAVGKGMAVGVGCGVGVG